jgi:4-methyl-5(b-hydroxyethyl)-thiazole monophosphate biosynthesis
MKKVLLLLANGFETYEASVFIDVLGWNYSVGKKNTEIITCGITEKVISTFNQTFIPNKIIDQINIDDYEALAIPGGFEEYGYYNDAYNEPFLELIKKFNTHGKIIASICVGALPVGRSGILKGKYGTTYAGKRQEQLQEYGVIIKNESIVIDENIITSWNPATAIHVAFKLLEMLTSKNNSDHIKRLMGF